MQIKSYSFLRRFLILTILSLSLYGCGVWTNFTTYFNLYYDATDIFDQAERDIAKQQTDIFAEVEPALAPTTNTQLVKVEEKCSQILQFHAESSYIDNALFMIGKCFYYQGSYRKALRKFEELIATQPKSSLILETRLWIGKSQMKLKDFDNSLTTLKDTREEAIKQDEREIAQNCFIEEIRYQIFKQDYSTSIDLAKSFLTISKNDVLNAQVAFEIGRLYNKLNDYTDAVVYYKKVTDYSPTYDLRFNAMIEQGRALRQIGENDKAMEIFDQLSGQQKYADALDQIDFERGETYLKMDKVDKAVDRFIYVDTTFSKLPSGGKSAFELGKIFLNNYKNFDSAAYYFSRVFSSTAPREFTDSARTYADQLRKYGVLYNLVQFNNKQLSYALDSTAFIKDSIVYYTELEKKLKAAKDDSLKNKEDRITGTPTKANLINSEKQAQLLEAQRTQQQQPGQPPLAQQQPGQQQPGQQLPGQQQPGQLQPGLQQMTPQQLLLLKSESKPPVRPKAPIDSLVNELVRTEFELGNLLFAEFDLPDSAYKYYSDIMTNYPASPYEGRILLAMGNYYLAVNDTVKADSTFNVVYDKFKSEDIVNAAAIKLNKPLIDFEYDPAKPLYAEAESLMMESKYDSSIANMYKLYLTHPKSRFASKALYAIGWMLETKNMNDSAAVIYDTLIKEFPRSIYAADVLPKLNYYKNEIVRLNKEKQDSLYALTRPKSDSLSTDSLLLNKQKPSSMAANISAGNNTTGDNLKENEPQNNAKDEKSFTDRNAIANPDTLIRNKGRGLRRLDR